MMGNFQKVFNPTEEDREEFVIKYLEILIDCIKNKSCTTCKYHTYYENETDEAYCTKKKCFVRYGCDEYEVCAINKLCGCNVAIELTDKEKELLDNALYFYGSCHCVFTSHNENYELTKRISNLADKLDL